MFVGGEGNLTLMTKIPSSNPMEWREEQQEPSTEYLEVALG
jgi:hypothetical protein